jgi:hypothetical protein
MYRTGLGDCFLLTFPGKNKKPFHMLVDCGVFSKTPNEKQILREVAAHIKTTTGGTLDVLVGTHEHYDHLIGFKHARDIFAGMTIREVWLSWIEKPGEPRAAWLRAIENKLKRGLQLALQQGMADPALAPRIEGLKSLLEFEGNPLAADYSEQMGEVKRWLRDDVTTSVRYLEPHGEAIEMAPGVRAYPLGPPLTPKFFRKMNDSKAKPETFGTEFAFSAVPAFLQAAAMSSQHVDASEMGQLARPFERRWQIAADAALTWRVPLRPDQQAGGRAEGEAFFAERYGFGDHHPDAWRRIDADWLSEAENLALQLDSLTNNSSLALAIEVGHARRVILMAADAQVGNWLFWHEGTWTAYADDGGRETVTAADLLSRTVLYKVGHHGSHNATLKKRGLEIMDSDELVAMIPVDQDFANNTKHWKMPFPALLTELTRRTKGRVMRADNGLPKKGDVQAEARKAFFARAKETPLYVEHLIPL